MKFKSLAEQLDYNYKHGLWSVLKTKGGYYMIVSTMGRVSTYRVSDIATKLEHCKLSIGYMDCPTQELVSSGYKVVGTLWPSECMGNEMFEVGTEVEIVEGKYKGYKGVILRVDDGGIPYSVNILYSDGDIYGPNYYTAQGVKPWIKEDEEEDEVTKAIKVLEKAGKIQDGKIINLS